MKKKSHTDSLLDSLIISCGSNQSMSTSSIKGNLCYVICTVMCKICSKLTIRAPDVVLVFLLLTLNIFDTFFWCFLLALNVNGRWNIVFLSIRAFSWNWVRKWTKNGPNTWFFEFIEKFCH